LTTTNNEGDLTRQLHEFAAKIPEPIGAQIASAVAQVERSGAAPGLEIGDLAPDFRLPNAVGVPVQLSERLAHGPVILSFYRGEWCPFCNLELNALQAALPRFRAYGASLIAISPQTPDHSLSVTEKNGLSFEVLSDVHQDAIRAYRVQFTVPAELQDLHLNVFHNDLSAHTADGSWDLPIPATFVIDSAGVIQARHVSADYQTRMDPNAIEAALRNLSPGQDR
jgi:peroxiredoxin